MIEEMINAVMFKIGSKYPTVAIWGDPIDPVIALEIIRRTDRTSYGMITTPDVDFTSDLLLLMHGDDCKRRKVHGRVHSNALQAAEIAAGETFRNLEGLDYFLQDVIAKQDDLDTSRWIKPDGSIFLITSFGKWADCDEIEDELTILVEAFPELKMNVCFWDSHILKLADNKFNEEPIGGWIVDHGEWHRQNYKLSDIPPEQLLKTTRDSIYGANPYHPQAHPTPMWSIAELDAMWGCHYARSRAKYTETYNDYIKKYVERIKPCNLNPKYKNQ